jgi:YesN/AraC family two-component response regulator
VVQMLSLKDIASFLNITPIYLSKLRKEMTYETRVEGKRACTMPRKKE